MRLTRMQIEGFKSFAIKAHIDFSPHGITAVVGPNGCGKSNLVDALRWVLGEQSAKNLRGKEMHDVLFAGTTSLPKMHYCQVDLLFEQEEGQYNPKYKDLKEIMVSRKINLQGQNEYLINKTPCRLMDVKELFLGTGLGGSKSYAIIEQESISAFLLARPNERRQMLDEAAGILKYKHRKQESKKRIEDSQQNLLRVKDLLVDLESRYARLKDQAEKAEIYLSLQGKIFRSESQISAYKWQEIGQKITLEKAKLEQAEASLEKSLIEGALIKNKLEQIKIEEQALSSSLQKARLEETATQDQLYQLDSTIKVAEKELSMLSTWDQTEQHKATDYRHRIERLKEDCAGLYQEKKLLEEKLKTLEEGLNALRKQKHGVSEEESKLQNAFLSRKNEHQNACLLLTEKQARKKLLLQNLAQLQSQQEDGAPFIAEFQRSFDRIDQEMQAHKHDQEQKQQQLSGIISSLAEQKQALEAADQTFRALAHELTSLDAEKNRLTHEKTKLEVELAYLKSQHTTHNAFVDKLLAEPEHPLRDFFLGPLESFFSLAEDVPALWLKKVEPYLGVLVFSQGLDLKLLLETCQAWQILHLQVLVLDEDAEAGFSTKEGFNAKEGSDNAAGAWPAFLTWQKKPLRQLYDLFQENSLPLAAIPIPMPRSTSAQPSVDQHFYCFPLPLLHYSSDQEASLWQSLLLKEKTSFELTEAWQKALDLKEAKEKALEQTKFQQRSLRRSFEEQKNLQSSLEKDLSHSVQQSNALAKEKANLEAMLKKRLADIETKNLSRKQAEIEQNQEIQSLEEEMVKLQSQKVFLEAELLSTEPLLQNLHAQNQDQQQKIQAEEIYYQNLSNDLAAKTQHLFMLEKNLSENQVALDDFKARAADLETQQTKLETNIKQQQTEKDRLATLLIEQKRRFSNKTSNFLGFKSRKSRLAKA